MQKIQINPNRLQWCLDTLDMDINTLSTSIKISQQTLENTLHNQAALSIKQLEKISNFFKRNILFFLDSSDVQEDKIYSIQFRTINNQTPISSPKLRAFIQRIEKKRQGYIDLLEDLNESITTAWHAKLDLDRDNIKEASKEIRSWLNLPHQYTFDDLRHSIENKGIMVIVSNGYNGKWQIEKNEHVRGFSLYYEVLPIIVIRKQSDGAQAFTLMHELAHLLLHKESFIDEEEDFYIYQGIEKEANEFAGYLLIPDEFISQVNVQKLLELDIHAYDDYLARFSNSWCVSVEAILVRLLKIHQISRRNYQEYKSFKIKQLEMISRNSSDAIIPRNYRYREPIKIFGKPFVYAVFDALHNKHITLAKASTYLDNLKISDVHKLEQHV